MRYLPNLFTLANLFCGCIAISYIVGAQPFLYNTGTPQIQWDWAYGMQQLHLGGLFICIAAVFDLLDGFTARALNVFSRIGKDLDSLADVVSFGVAPAMILYRLLWDATMHQPHMTDVSLLYTSPAFLIACFAALRLARFNVMQPKYGGSFTGMPTPAIGLIVASFALMDWDNPAGFAAYFQYPWVLYGIIALLCWLMVSPLQFMKLMPARKGIQNMWPQAALVVLAAALIAWLHYDAAPYVFLAYIILSLIAPKMKAPPNSEQLNELVP